MGIYPKQQLVPLQGYIMLGVHWAGATTLQFVPKIYVWRVVACCGSEFLASSESTGPAPVSANCNQVGVYWRAPTRTQFTPHDSKVHPVGAIGATTRPLGD